MGSGVSKTLISYGKHEVIDSIPIQGSMNPPMNRWRG